MERMMERMEMVRKWPDLVGTSGNEAQTKIQTDRPDVQIHILPEGSMVTMDRRENRVR